MRTAPAHRLPVAVLVASLALETAACKRAAERMEEKAIERQTGAEVHLDSKGGTMTFASDAGTLVAGAGTKVPDDFPKAIPLYPGAKVDLAAKANDPKGKPAWTLTLETGDSKDQVVAYYKAKMTGFNNASDMSLGDTDMSVWRSADYNVTLMVNTAGNQKTAITITAAGN
jgi:hypothetical protein